MKKATLILMTALMGLTSYAQTDATTTLKFGYLSYKAVIMALPDYATSQAGLEELRKQYSAEQKRVEDDFNKKYEEFLDGQSSFPKIILQKRQSELQEMLDKNIAFKKQGEQLLSNAEAAVAEEYNSKVSAAVEEVGKERGYAFVMNTDSHQDTWLNPDLGEDITSAVMEKLLRK